LINDSYGQNQPKQQLDLKADGMLDDFTIASGVKDMGKKKDLVVLFS
jgi:hypothetical protein